MCAALGKLTLVTWFICLRTSFCALSIVTPTYSWVLKGANTVICLKLCEVVKSVPQRFNCVNVSPYSNHISFNQEPKLKLIKAYSWKQGLKIKQDTRTRQENLEFSSKRNISQTFSAASWLPAGWVSLRVLLSPQLREAIGKRFSRQHVAGMTVMTLYDRIINV